MTARVYVVLSGADGAPCRREVLREPRPDRVRGCGMNPDLTLPATLPGLTRFRDEYLGRNAEPLAGDLDLMVGSGIDVAARWLAERVGLKCKSAPHLRYHEAEGGSESRAPCGEYLNHTDPVPAHWSLLGDDDIAIFAEWDPNDGDPPGADEGDWIWIVGELPRDLAAFLRLACLHVGSQP